MPGPNNEPCLHCGRDYDECICLPGVSDEELDAIEDDEVPDDAYDKDDYFSEEELLND